MATLVNVHEAKTNLSKLLRRVEAGEDVIIGRAGEPVARLTRVVAEERAPRPLGTWRGRVQIADDFDAPLEEVADRFEAARIEPGDG